MIARIGLEYDPAMIAIGNEEIPQNDVTVRALDLDTIILRISQSQIPDFDIAATLQIKEASISRSRPFTV
jgi:hypothetical protein